ncbi:MULTISPECIES: tRNA (adenine(22)-N(1))-methyltransferase TrmK [Vagococcus]|uniref:Putative tRNA-m1A22 methylase n=1 Tax=Vagococcus fluvialis bH819 TaxID=1255619 RepID=A0A1X6WNB4_9ENTE|nr:MULTISPECIES: tRNA (adenine(22)-N(1))-methyltransferase TrmK [Vagococcus]SLM85748.1 Putative tRNA-m1A22 methylase [Vagococcus fluvialis bH819]HCM90170.1 tRNA (adenine(22)-N(1))-methyltransferase TrmK [Vagococcus sp.]
MDHKQLSKRLERVGEFVPKNAILADIGSDHAYLPANLILNKQIQTAIAGEVVEGPYQSAKHLVAELNLTKQISVRKGDGLEVINSSDNVTAISICGMGGTLIRDILNRGYLQRRLSGKEVLILQANIGEQTLRMWLVDHNYIIENEEIIYENEKTYEIIVAIKSDKNIPLTEEEIMFGPILLKNRTVIFKEKWESELKQDKNILKQLKKSTKDVSQKIADINKKIEMVEEVLK